MRRWFIVFLLLLSQLQFVWAAAAAYCGHERNAAASTHFGHHEHRHRGIDVQAADEADSGLASLHLDCETCHFGNSGSLPTQSILVAAPPHFQFCAERSQSFTSHVPSTPEHPDRVSHLAAA